MYHIIIEYINGTGSSTSKIETLGRSDKMCKYGLKCCAYARKSPTSIVRCAYFNLTLHAIVSVVQTLRLTNILKSYETVTLIFKTKNKLVQNRKVIQKLCLLSTHFLHTVLFSIKALKSGFFFIVFGMLSA